MPLCPKCGHQNPSGKFCIKCGARLVSAAPETMAKVDILQKRIAQDSLNPNLYLELGEVYQRAGMLNEALVEYQKVVTLDTCHVVAHVNIGTIYLNQSHHGKAVEFFEKALQLSHGSTDVKKRLLAVYHQTGNVDSTIKLGEEILSAEPENLEIRKAVTAAYKKKNSDKQVGKQIEAMLKLAPNDKDVLVAAAGYYATHNQIQKATRYYSRLATLNPDDTSITVALARCHCVSKEFGQCIQLLANKLTSLNSDEKLLASIYLAYSHAKLGNMQEAIYSLDCIQSTGNIELNLTERSAYAEAASKVGIYQESQGNLDASVRFLRIASTIQPDNPDYKKLLDHTQAALSDRQRKSRKRIFQRIGLSAVIVAVLIAIWQGYKRYRISQLPQMRAVIQLNIAPFLVDIAKNRDWKFDQIMTQVRAQVESNLDRDIWYLLVQRFEQEGMPMGRYWGGGQQSNEQVMGELQDKTKRLIVQAVEIIHKRLDGYGVHDLSVQTGDSWYRVAALFRFEPQSPNTELEIRTLLQSKGLLEFRMLYAHMSESVLETINRIQLEQHDPNKPSPMAFTDPENPLGEILVADENKERMVEIIEGHKSWFPALLWSAKPRVAANGKKLFALYSVGDVKLTGRAITNAQAGIDPISRQSVVTIEMNSEGSREFARFTGGYINGAMATILDSSVISASVIRALIVSGRTQIGGFRNLEEAQVVAIMLKAGPLDAPFDIIKLEVLQ